MCELIRTLAAATMPAIPAVQVSGVKSDPPCDGAYHTFPTPSNQRHALKLVAICLTNEPVATCAVVKDGTELGTCVPQHDQSTGILAMVRRQRTEEVLIPCLPIRRSIIKVVLNMLRPETLEELL